MQSESERAKEALSFAQSIGFPDLAYPEIVIQHVSTGILDKGRVLSRLSELKNAPANQPSLHSSGLWNEIWRIYAASFRDNPDAIRDSIEKFLDAEADLLDLKSYKSLKTLAESVELDISAYEQEAHVASVRRAAREDLPKLRALYRDNPVILAVIEERIENELGRRSISDIVRNAIDNNSWSSADEYDIQSRGKASILGWLREEEADKVDLVRQLIRMDKTDTVNGCLHELASESELNRMRASQIYGLEQEEEK